MNTCNKEQLIIIYAICFASIPNGVMLITLIEVKCNEHYSSRIREKDKTAHFTAVLAYLFPCGGQQDVGHEGGATRGGVISLRSFITTCNVNQEDYSRSKVL